MMHLALIPPGSEFFDPLWPIIAPLLEKACEYSNGMHTLASTETRLRSGACQLWVVIDDEKKIVASATTSFLDFPSGVRAMMIELVAGDNVRVWFTVTDQMEKWAADNGAQATLFPVSHKLRDDFIKSNKGYRNGRFLMVKDLPHVSAA